MADYNNAVVFYDASGIEYSKQIKKTLERGFERECFLINLDNRENTLSKLNLAMKTSKYIIFLFSSIYPNENMLEEAKTAFNSDKHLISLKLNDPEFEHQLLVHQSEFEDNYTLSKKASEEVEKLKKMEKRGPDFLESQISFNMGNIYFNFGKYAEAIRCYKKAVKIIPDFVDALHNFNTLSNMNLLDMGSELKKTVSYKDTRIDELVPDIFSNAVSEEPVEDQKYSELEPEDLEELILEGEIGENIEVPEHEQELVETTVEITEIEKSKDNLKINVEESIKNSEDNENETIELIDYGEDKIDEENIETSILETEFDEEIVESLEKETEEPEFEKNLIEDVELISEVPTDLDEDVEILDINEETIEIEAENMETFEEFPEETTPETEKKEEQKDDGLNNEFLEILSFANTLYESGDFAAAESEYEKAIEINPNHSEARNHYGCLLEYLEKYDEAESEFKKAIELNSLNSKAHNNLATFLAKSEKYAEAEEHYKKAIAIDPDYWAAIYNLAAMYATLKRYDDAIAQVKNMVKIFRADGNIKEVLELKKLIKHLKKLKIQKC